MSQAEKLAFWKEEFQHCIKCYGCRNICPQCFCNVCALEDETWVETGRLPMPIPSMYHLIRAMHMTAKCVACRECEETCPADIPMAVQFRLIARDVKEMFNYETGAVMDQKPPQLLVLEEGEYERTGSAALRRDDMIEYKNVLTTCPYCGTGCALHLQVLDEKLVGVLPAKNHVDQRGWAVHQRLERPCLCQPPDRLTNPADPQEWQAGRSDLGRGADAGRREAWRDQGARAARTASPS